MDKVENFIKRIGWKVQSIFFENSVIYDNDNYTNYELRSRMSPLQNLALTLFENDVYTVVRNIEFKNVRNNASEIRSSKNLFVFQNKPANLQNLSEQITTDFQIKTLAVIIENVKMVFSIKSADKQIKKYLNCLKRRKQYVFGLPRGNICLYPPPH